MTDLSRIEVVALDFDGTLLDPGHLIREEARESIHRAVAAGVRIATASGRPFDAQQMILEQNELGAAAGVPQAVGCDERTIYLLDGDGYVPLQPWNHEVESAWDRLTPVALALLAEAERDLAAKGLRVERHVSGDDVHRRGILDLRFESEEACTGHGPWLAERVAAVTDELQVTWNWHLLQIILRAAGKGNSLAALAAAWGLEPDRILAVGDRNNDWSMLDGSADLTPACVGNAVAPIKELVRRGGGYVAAAETGLGVAEIIDAVVNARG